MLKFKRDVDEFVDDHLAHINETKDAAEENGEIFWALPYAWSIEPELIPAHKHVAQIAIYSHIYLGGAHGVPSYGIPDV